MKIKLVIFIVLVSTIFILIACNIIPEESESSGSISLSLTDAPLVDAEDVEGVYITIDSIAYNSNDEWITATTFTGPETFNLLELTGGSVAPLADTEIASGEVTQIRFLLDQSGCYIALDPDGLADGDSSDDITHELTIPSGEQTGYKANGPFTVPVNGTVEITADFDVRKSVVLRGNGTYLLKPTIRLIVNNQAGEISGSFTDNTSDDYDSYLIFAYESGEYSNDELTPQGVETPQFPNAVSSILVGDTNDDGTLDYTLAFLAAGTYDLIVAGIGSDDYVVVDQSHTGIEVTSELTTTEDIDLN